MSVKSRRKTRKLENMSSPKPLWIPIHIAELLAETQGLSTEQLGAYVHLQMAYWRTGPLADDEEDLAFIVRMSLPAWRKAARKLSKLFTVADGVWQHSRLDQELKKATGFIEQRAAA